jgi:hypothetical protein
VAAHPIRNNVNCSSRRKLVGILRLKEAQAILIVIPFAARMGGFSHLKLDLISHLTHFLLELERMIVRRLYSGLSISRANSHLSVQR